ncbi:MAG: sugar phosphate isomerase/epimerase family protein [Tepidisphaerales bacterium]
MNHTVLSRRNVLLATAAAACAPLGTATAQDKPAGPFIFCLNGATIMGQKLPISKQIEVAAKAGYNAFEPWVSHINDHVKAGGTLADLRKQIADSGLTIEDAIGFAQWIVEDDAKRAKGLEDAKHDMDAVAQIGGKRMAAPASGGTDKALDPHKVAERYRALAEIGDKAGIVPLLEVWGFSKTLTRLSDATYVAMESRHPKAAVLPDVFHLYRGESAIEGLAVLSRAACPIIHMNDYPTGIEPARIKDENRIYPGDGVAPLKQILKYMVAVGTPIVLSLEIFNREYWKLDALDCAKRGLDKMKAAATAAIA